MTREELLVTVAARLLALPEDRPQAAAIDGLSGAGKTTLAGEVADVVSGAGRPVVRVSYDDFHQPAARRHQQGRLSPEGYLEDSYDADALHRLVLGPLAAGAATVVRASYDLASEVPVRPEPVTLEAGAVVLVEGEFLLGLRHGWDLGVLLVADPAVVLERVLARDADLGPADAVRESYLRRYFAAWSLYEDRAAPWSRADLVVDLTDPGAPVLVSDSS